MQLPPTLLSRFDLIYLVLDQPNEVVDRRLAQHLVSLYYENVPKQKETEVIPFSLLTKYISYARARVNPVLTDAAATALINGTFLLLGVSD